ncbi:MAG: glycosyltransferase family 2 protein [Bacteroidia bacterium]
MRVAVIIPAFNEENAIANVVRDIPSEIEATILVCNNGSSDRTAAVAKEAGALVLTENRKGYGYACLKGMNYIENHLPNTDVVVFIDGDYSDYPEEMPKLLNEIEAGFDIVIGSRALGQSEKGSMTIPQRFGNWLSGILIRLIWGVKVTDLGPFRAMKWKQLQKLNMQDPTYGWTVEMQIKAIKGKMAYKEIAVNYRQRIGTSKVSGTVKGAIFAGTKILYTIFKYAF